MNGDADGGGGQEDQARLPRLAEGQRLAGLFEALTRRTRPPPRHTEASLLGAMESAGREIEDEALRAAMKDAGLGTPATRAATIEVLLRRGFVVREGKQLVPTPTGIELIKRLPVPTLASPELTGAWEARLARIARGEETRAAFMADIARYVREVTQAIGGEMPGRTGAPPIARASARASAPPPRTSTSTSTSASAAAPTFAPARTAAPGVASPSPSSSSSARGRAGARAPAKAVGAPEALACPRCRQGQLIAGKRGWGCSRWREGCPFVVWFEVAGRRLTGTQVRDLVEKGKTRKGKWVEGSETPVAGRLVLDLEATREAGAARLVPDLDRPRRRRGRGGGRVLPPS